MASQQTRPARGMRDFLPEDVRRRDYVIGVVAAVYQRYGFEPLETPALENIETLTGKYGEEGNKLIFKVLRRGEHESSGETDLALRYDLTVPLARVVAEYRGKLPRFFKRYQIQAVWRADRPARGRFREFYQCDVDAIGSKSMVVEAELCAAVSDVLLALGFAAFDIKVNHRAVLTGLLSATGIPLPFHGTALVAIDKLDKIGRDGVRRELVERGIGEPAADAALDIFKDGVTIEQVRGALTGRVEALAGLDDVRQIFELSQATAAGAHLRFDPSLARGLSYYTGAIMEIAVPDLAGSLGGGGRYDNLIGLFLGRDVPACGFSLGLERIIVVMTERNMFPTDVVHRAVDVMITMWNEDTRGDALALASDLRRAGLRVDVYPEAEKLGKQFKYAATRRVRFVAILGDDERAQGNVSIKDLGSSEQQTVARAEAGAFIKQRIEANG